MCDDLRAKYVEEAIGRRELIINSLVDDSLIENVVLRIKQFNEEDDEIEFESKIYKREMAPIRLYVNSSGGDADPMFSVISAIESSKTPVETYCLGKAYSAGFMIFIAGHKRFAQKFSRFMYHQLSYGYIGDMASHEEKVGQEKETQKIVEEYVLDKTKISKKKLEEIRKSKIDWYMFAEEAKKLGIFSEYF